MTITSLKAEHSLDIPGPPPQFGIAFTANCQEAPGAIVTWSITGGDPNVSAFATCFQGSFGTVPETVVAIGCGSHTLTAVVQDLEKRTLGGPMTFPFHVC
jgi:hypothetical protein